MKKKKHITNKTLVFTAAIGSVIVLAMVLANTIWSSRRLGATTSEAVSAVSSFYLEAMADRSARTITNLIHNSFDEMEKAIAFIADEEIHSQEELRDTLGKIKSLLGLQRFALVDEDNIVYTQYTTYTGGSRHPFLADEQLPEQVVDIVSPYGSSKQLCLAIPTPDLSLLGRPLKACFIQLDISDIVEMLAFDDQGRTYFALYSENGGNLSGTDLGSVIANRNFFDAIESLVSEEVWEENWENFENEADGSVSFTADGDVETLYYVPIEDADLELAVLIRERVIQDQIRDISARNATAGRNQIIFTLVSVLILVIILLLEYRKLSQGKLEEEKENSRAFRDMANTDSLTGVRNKHAYTENETAINQQIQAGELEKLAIVVGDINGLKHVNDTKGHAAGDQLIKNACSLICEYFTHGAVFRIGGDEFAVILQGKGYDTMHEVISEINHKVEENIKTDDVVISIGYSILEPKDSQLRDVFERADQMMYERKKELKSMGAWTSRL